jgi:arylsulfatase A-like enzyme
VTNSIARIVFVTLALFVLTVSASAAASQSPPNVLIILSDDQSAPHLGCYGNKDVHTPNIDKLASEGMRFDRAYQTSPQCAPSRGAMISGRHTIDIGMIRFSAPLPRDVVMYPELLRAQKGYYAGLCGRAYHLNGALMNNPNIKPHLAEEDFSNIPDRLDYVKTAPGDKDQDAPLRKETVRQFQEFLGQVPKGKPFFLQLCWHDPHRPFSTDELPYKHDPAKLTLPPFYPDSPAIRADLAAYYDEVARMDGNTGTVLKILEERGLKDNTIVIFMGDNGASQYRGKGTLNELGIHVPLIVRWPGVVKAGTSSSALVSGEDLAPTLLQVASVEAPKNLTGVSFLDILKDSSAKSKRAEVISERGPHASSLPRGAASFDLGRSIVTDRYKLIYNVTWQLPYQPVDFNLDNIKALDKEGKLEPKFKQLYLAESRPMFEMYDLENDPYEMDNLDGKKETNKIEQDLKGRLAAWMIHHRDFCPLPINGK